MNPLHLVVKVPRRVKVFSDKILIYLGERNVDGKDIMSRCRFYLRRTYKILIYPNIMDADIIYCDCCCGCNPLYSDGFSHIYLYNCVL